MSKQDMFAVEESKFGLFIHACIKLFDFLDNPRDIVGWCYHIFLILSNFVYMVIIVIETADGPNYYDDRENMSLYKQLPTYQQYLIIKLVFSVPLMLHCILRVGLALFLHYFSGPYTERSFSRFFEKTSNFFMLLWFWPLVLTSAIPSLWPRSYMAIYHCIDFLRHLQIIQSLKEVPSFVVVKETFRRVARLVPIPVFIFFVFNIFVGVILYLVDPCFNYDTCPFATLFDAVFFSIVTMTTTGYGNQTPQYVPGRIVAFAIMLFGAPYLAIPIGIIDQEFGKSWQDYIAVQKENEKRAKQAGIEIKKAISDEQALLADGQSIPESKVKILLMHSSVTELLLAAKSDVKSLAKVGQADQQKIVESLTPIIVKLSRLHHRFLSLGDGILSQAVGQENKLGDRRKMGTTSIGRSSGTSDQRHTDQGKKETADLIASLAKEAQASPLKSHLRLLLDMPNSSDEAYIINIIIVSCIVFSILLLFWQTMTQFVPHGESSQLCMESVRIYCENKFNPSLDPGCFATSSLNQSTPTRLEFDCSTSNCYGFADNFGAGGNYTCWNTGSPWNVRPFRTQDDLRSVTWLDSRSSFQQNFDICYRRECSESKIIFDANYIWLCAEVLINVIFMLEIAARLYMAPSLKRYLAFVPNWFDIMSVIPFIIEVASSLSTDTNREIGFRFISSSPLEYSSKFSNILKIVRMLKLVRRFPGAQIVLIVFSKAWKELVRFYCLLLLFAVCVGILLYDVNRGHPCYVGVDCPDDFMASDAASSFRFGQRVLVNDKHELPTYYNAMYGIWFTMVTMSTVGYGDLNPSFWPEYVIAIILMLCGAFLMAIPLSVITRHFSSTYGQLVEKQVQKRRAMQSFALNHRKSSAFTVAASTAKRATENVGRRLSTMARRNSTAPEPEMAASSSKKKDVDAKKDLRMTEIVPKPLASNLDDDVEGDGEDSAEHRTLGLLKKHLSFSGGLHREMVDAKALTSEYQTNAKMLLANVKSLCKSILDKQAYKTIRNTIRHSMHSSAASSTSALQAFQERMAAKKALIGKEGGADIAVGGGGRPSLTAIDEDENSEDDEEEEDGEEGGGDDEEKTGNLAGNRLRAVTEEVEDGSEEEDEKKPSKKGAVNFEGYAKLASVVPEASPTRTSQSSPNGVRTSGISRENRISTLKADASIDAIMNRLTEVIDRLVNFHVPKGSDIRQLLGMKDDFEDDSSAVYELFRENIGAPSSAGGPKQGNAAGDNRATVKTRWTNVVNQIKRTTGISPGGSQKIKKLG